ncbi:MAG: hypothetical protein K8L91_23705 [Anaerolineae bacterium]|nr:hypothetical protein [Anaerolineae bacterium]
MTKKPHIIIIIPRGEAVRNFLYSDTLRVLSENATITLLSVIHDEVFAARFGPLVEQIVPLLEHDEPRWIRQYRSLVHNAHFCWLGSGVARWRFEYGDSLFDTLPQKVFRNGYKTFLRLLANRPVLDALTSAERYFAVRFVKTDDLRELYEQIQPDLVFNTSHVHGHASDLPMHVAYSMGIPTAGFIFSWDNLTSRSRIYVPYNYYLVWNGHMHDELLHIYSDISPEQVFITGTPQFDFHFKPEHRLSREELANRLGIDPARPFILYTTGIDRHFPKEHLTVRLVIDLLKELDVDPKPQLVVRTYAKGTSKEMLELAERKDPHVVFPPVMWDKKWFMPAEEDISLYSSLLHETCLGINAASTVTLELLMLDKPVINLGFDPPDSNLHHRDRYGKHVDEFDHFIPVRNSGATMIARAVEDMRNMLYQGLTDPNANRDARKRFISQMFGEMLDGKSGERIANTLITLARG